MRIALCERSLARALRAWCLVCFVAAINACAAPVSWIQEWRDPIGDDHGPGTYVYPEGDRYLRGGFDLKSLRMGLTEDDLVIEVRFARRVPTTQLKGADGGASRVFMPTVDLYLDLAPAQGRTTGLPGRRVSFASEQAWDLAVVLSPIPAMVEQLMTRGELERVVLIPRVVRVSGDRLRARVPRQLLGDVALESVGVGVVVSGTVLRHTFQSLLSGQLPTSLVREVTAVAGHCDRWDEDSDGAPCTFGGCGSCEGHPRVVDVLYPDPGVQERSLARYQDGRNVLAQVPLCYVPGNKPSALPPAEVRELDVLGRRDETLTARLDPERAQRMEVGALVVGVDTAGRELATLALTARHPEGVLVFRLVSGDSLRVTRIRVTIPPVGRGN